MEGCDVTHAEAIARLRDRCAEAGSQAALARQIGLTKGMISGIINGHFDLTDRVLEAIGLERVVTYQERDQ